MTSEPSEKRPVARKGSPEGVAARYDALVSAVDAGVCLLDSEGRVLSVDGDFTALVGKSDEDAVGRPLSDFFSAVDSSPRVETLLADLLDSEEESDDGRSAAGTLADGGPCVDVRLQRVEPMDSDAVHGDDGDDAVALAVVRERPDAHPSPGARPMLVPDAESRDELVDAESQFESLVDAVEEYAIFVLDANGRVATWNEGAAKITGYDREEILGEHYATFYTEADAEAGAPEENLAVAREGGSVDMEGWRVRKDGSQFWANATLTAIRSDDGTLFGYTKVTRDMSTQRERRTQMREERDLLQQVLTTSPTGIVVLAPDGSIVRGNSTGISEFGYVDEDISVSDFDVYDADGDSVPTEELPFLRVFETGEPVTDWVCQLDTDDGLEWLSVNASPITDADGRVHRVVVAVEDITEYKRQQAEIEGQRDQLASEISGIFDRVTDGFFGLDKDWTFTYVNDRAEELLGSAADELVGENIWDRFEEESAEMFRERYEHAMETQEPVDFEGYYEEPLDRWFHVSAYPSETGLSVYFRDVTEDKAHERELEQYHALIESVSDVLVTIDESSTIRSVNPAVEDVLGYEPSAVVGESLTVLMPELFHEQHFDGIERYLETGERHLDWNYVELPGLRRSGEEIPLAISFSEVEYEGERLFTGVMRDVSERKQRERELAESEERYRLLVENLPNSAVTVFDTDLQYMLAGGGAFDDIDITPDDIIGRSVFEVFDDYAGEDGDVHERALAGEEVTRELSFAGRDYENHIRPIRGDDGEVVAAMSLSMDVTERKEYEETLTALNDATQTLPHAETKREVSERLVDVATEILGLPGVAVYLHDSAAGVLHEAAHSEDMAEIYGELGPLSDDPQSSVTSNAFDGGKTRVYENVMESDLVANESAVRRSLFVPLGDHGILLAGDATVGSFDERSIKLAELVGANATSALDRVEREERLRQNERELRRYEQIVDTVWDGVYALDDEGRFVLANGAFLEMAGYEREELINQPAEVVYDTDITDDVKRLAAEVERGERDVAIVEFDLISKDGDTVPVESRFGPYRYTDDTYGRTGVVRDITERRKHEAQLQTRIRQQRAVTELGQFALETTNLDWVFRKATELVAETLDNDYCKVLDLDSDANELLLRQGVGWHDGIVGNATVPSDTNSQAGYTLISDDPVVVSDLDNETRFTGPDLLVDHDVRSGISVVIGEYDDPWGILGTHDREEKSFTEQDVNFVLSVANILSNAIGRAQQERELQTRIRQQEAVTELGQYALGNPNFDELLRKATHLVAETLDVSFSKALDLDPDRNLLSLRAGVGWDRDSMGDTVVSANTDTQAGYTLLTDQPITIADFETERRFQRSDLLVDHGARSGVSVVVGPQGDPWGVLAAHDDSVRQFSENDVTFVQSVANILASAVNRQRQDTVLEHQREQLAALNQLNRVVQGINKALVRKSSREEIEELVCNRLADTYLFAWIGEVGRGDREVRVRTESGVENYLDGLSIDLDGGTAADGPTERAIKTGEMQVTNHISDNDDYQPWHENAAAYGYESSVAIPITYEGSVYGVLNVYSERTDAFSGQEGAVLGQLGDIIGHAIHSVEQKQALLSDEMVELEFYLPNVMDFVGESGRESGRIQFERVIPTGDGEYLIYGSMDEPGHETMERLLDTLPHFERLRILSEEDDVAFELQLKDPPGISLIGNHGGRVSSATIEGSNYEMKVRLPQTADVRVVVNALKEQYPNVELLAQRRTQRSEQSTDRTHSHLTAELTDRQRAVLEAAFRSGFFEWPRESTGEDVADSVGITASTLHQHLRAAEQKLVGAYLDG